MARKRKGSSAGMSALLPIVILIGLAAQVPQPIWILLGVVALLASIVWLIFRLREQTQTATLPPNKPSSSKPNQRAVPERPLATVVLSPSVSEGFERVQLGSSSSQTFTIPKSTTQSSPPRWLKLSESVEVSGLRLPGGLVYFTQRGQASGDADPSLIDASLKVSKEPVDVSVRRMDYWPSYASVTPEARRAYLEWQAGGRSDPVADIGYIFLFFYGLERRALLDGSTDANARLDIPVIEAEVRRLLSTYGHNHSFRGYATRFLDHLKIREVAPKAYLDAPQFDQTGSYELPLPIRIALGQMAVDKCPLESVWALAWALNDPNIARRTPVDRCAEKFALLFQQECSRRYPKGIVLLNNKTRLKVSYRPASLGLRVPAISVGDLPDVTATSGTRKKLQALVDHCTTALDPYSRYLGRNPDSADALDGLVLLPTQLWSAEAQRELEIVKNSVALGTHCMSLGELAGRFKSSGSLSRDRVIALAKAFETLNIGFEPDVISGARTPKTDDTIALFATSPEEATLRTDDAYHAAAVTLDLASAVAVADGDASLEELHLLSSHIDSWTHLAPGHRKRLNAHLAIQVTQPPTLASLKKKLDPLGMEAKRKIASFLSHLAQADGQVSPAEVKLLERVYKALSLDPKAVYSDLHSAAGSTSISPPRATTELSESELTSTVPPTDGFSLNMSKIAQLQQETAEVSALLAGVFADDSPAAPATLPDQEARETPDALTSPTTSQDATVYGLDIDHSAFLRLLVSRKQWSRAELEDAASDLDLMLDGALEQINDMAFDRFDMPFSEGEDPVEINPEILDELSL